MPVLRGSLSRPHDTTQIPANHSDYHRDYHRDYYRDYRREYHTDYHGTGGNNTGIVTCNASGILSEYHSDYHGITTGIIIVELLQALPHGLSSVVRRVGRASSPPPPPPPLPRPGHSKGGLHLQLGAGGRGVAAGLGVCFCDSPPICVCVPAQHLTSSDGNGTAAEPGPPPVTSEWGGGEGRTLRQVSASQSAGEPGPELGLRKTDLGVFRKKIDIREPTIKIIVDTNFSSPWPTSLYTLRY